VPGQYADPEPPVIVGVCHTCEARFYRGQEEDWQRHVGQCAREHLDEVMDARAEQKKRLSIFDEESWDPEWAAHQRDVGKRMLAEGRLVAKPNER
jgi:NMD protein affecting ribosome stability and mRNA decay